MKEARELQTLIEQLNSYINAQTRQIESLQNKMRGALAALQTGQDIDVVAAIKILRGEQ
jgi:hypothetical protein